MQLQVNETSQDFFSSLFFPSPFSLLLTPHLRSFYFLFVNFFVIALLIGLCVCVCVSIGVTLFNKVHAKASQHMVKLHGKTSQSNLQYPHVNHKIYIVYLGQSYNTCIHFHFCI